MPVRAWRWVKGIVDSSKRVTIPSGPDDIAPFGECVVADMRGVMLSSCHAIPRPRPSSVPSDGAFYPFFLAGQEGRGPRGTRGSRVGVGVGVGVGAGAGDGVGSGSDPAAGFTRTQVA